VTELKERRKTLKNVIYTNLKNLRDNMYL